jgi:cysteine synthase
MKTASAPSTSSSVLDAIGNTPLVELRRIAPVDSARIFLKLEYYSPTASYKDRMARSVIEGAERRGTLKPGMRVVEFTGGSTGSSLAMVCAVKGYRFTPISSDAFAKEKLDTMRAMGGELILVDSDAGKITKDLFDRMRAATASEAAQPGAFFADQFNNDDVMEGYAGIAHELLDQLGPGISAFCGAIGTGGMLVGVSRTLKAAGCGAKIVALEPAESPALSTGKGGPHGVEGTASGSWPPHLKREDFDEVRTIPESAARAMARRLAREEGILAGTSSGLNVCAAVDLAKEIGPGGIVVTVAVDSGLKYLAGDLYTA